MKRILFVLLVAFGISFASCSTTHKVKTSTHEKVDSITSVVKDSSNVSKVDSSTSSFTANAVDIEFDYDTDSGYNSSTTVPLNQPSKDPLVRTIQNAISASGSAGRLPSKVKIHIDKPTATTSQVIKQDSGVVKTVAKTDLKKQVDTKSKTVEHTGLSAGIQIGIGAFIFVLFAVIAYKVYKKVNKVP